MLGLLDSHAEMVGYILMKTREEQIENILREKFLGIVFELVFYFQ